MEALLSHLFLWVDAILILPYRLPQNALTGFLVGTFILTVLCVMVGEVTLAAAIRWNRRHIDTLTEEVARKESLSYQAYDEGDKESYKALNKAASDAWGRHFFTMAAYSAGMLWPVPFALAWMQTRFQEIEFSVFWPFSVVLGQSVGYPFIFIPIYIATRILFGRLRPHLPYFRGLTSTAEQPSAVGGPRA